MCKREQQITNKYSNNITPKLQLRIFNQIKTVGILFRMPTALLQILGIPFEWFPPKTKKKIPSKSQT